MKFLFLAATVFLASCQSKNDHKSVNRFSDPVLVKIADFKDRRMADSLYSFFPHANAAYRREAVEAFGSVQVAANLDAMGKLLLLDSDATVRKAAAFALGQIEHPTSERVLLGAVVKEKEPANLFEILQAYGKVTSRWDLNAEHFISDSLKASGLAWSVYRAGMRGKTDEKANGVAIQLLQKHLPVAARLGAAHYFARGAKDFEHAVPALTAAATLDPSNEVRMAAALALAKVPSDSVLLILKKIIKTDKDAKVLISAIRALRAFPFKDVKHYLYEALLHKDVHLAIAASEIIVEILPAEDWTEVSSLINQINHWRIAANLYEAVMKAGRNKDLAAEIQGRYAKAQNPYQRAWLIGALKHYAPAFDFVETELRNADTAVVRTSAAASLAAMSKVKGITPAMKSRFANTYVALMKSERDPAILGTIAATLADSTLEYRSIITDPSFLYEARKRLHLPEHYEAIQPIEAAIAYLEKRKATHVQNEFNHPIDWQLIKNIPEDQRAVIKTNRGNIVMRLLVNESPGSVANFISLANKDYFDGKFFHRVVPNFVIQAGCNRGDGWGGENYSIRSEFSPRLYRTGSVGMASAGKDTESTQWFITHSPTPHLDGRYTIFAEVVEGWRVLDYIGVGDKITDVIIEDFKTR